MPLYEYIDIQPSVINGFCGLMIGGIIAVLVTLLPFLHHPIILYLIGIIFILIEISSEDSRIKQVLNDLNERFDIQPNFYRGFIAAYLIMSTNFWQKYFSNCINKSECDHFKF